MSDAVQPDAVAERIPHSGTAERSRNLPIQWLRALAAFMVLLFHASGRLFPDIHAQGWPTIFDLRFGYFGIALFFAISGYLMATAIRVQKPFVFLAHRIARIYPPYLLVAVSYCLLRTWSHDPIALDYRSLTLAPVGGFGGALGVEWTLVLEVTFYLLLFCLGLLRGARFLPALALVWLALILAAKPLGLTLFLGPLSGLLGAESAPMAAGLLIPQLLKVKPPPYLLLLAGLLAWGAFGYLMPANDACRYCAGIGGVLIVAAAVRLVEIRPDFGISRAGRIFATAGDYSYALYLCHYPVMVALYRGDHTLSTITLWWAAMIGSLTLAAVIGRADLFIYRHLKQAIRLASPPILTAVAAIFVAIFCVATVTARLDAIARDDFTAWAQQTATQLAARHDPVKSIAALGLQPAKAVNGKIDSLTRTGDTLTIAGWAADTGHRPVPVIVLFFQQGYLVGIADPSRRRVDVWDVYKTGLGSGFSLPVAVPCRADEPFIGVVLTQTHRYALLKPANETTCREP